MTRHDSRTAIYCHELLHKKYAPNAFPGLTPDDLNPVFEEFKDLGFTHEKKAITALKAAIPGLIEIDQTKKSDQIQLETVKAILNPDAEVITGAYIAEIAERELAKAFDVAFVPSVRSSKPDVMIRVGTRSDGRPAWAPVDIKSHNPITDSKSNSFFLSEITKIDPSLGKKHEDRIIDNDLHQLAHYTRHFQAIGIDCDGLWAGIIGRDLDHCVWQRMSDVVVGRGKTQNSFLEKYDQQFADAVNVVQLSLIENADLTKKSGVMPVNSTGKMGCTACKYKSTCLNEMKAFDKGNGHVTLLARVTPLSASEKFPGIASIKELEDATPQNPAMVVAQVRARVWRTGSPEVIDPAKPYLIPEADIEIDIDLENSMEVLRELEIDEPMGVDRLYLYGFGIHDRTKSKDWHTAAVDTYFNYSNTEEGEIEVLTKMWNRLQSEVQKAEESGKSIKIYHYSFHEVMWWNKFATRYKGKAGVPSQDEVDRFISSYFVDLRPYAEKWSFPLMSYSIKDLAPFAGFEWSVDMAGGANSLFKYKLAIDPKAKPADREEAITWLDSYNRDDVRATFAVRNYIRSLG
jgi:predicted RecB family nuclease